MSEEGMDLTASDRVPAPAIIIHILW